VRSEFTAAQYVDDVLSGQQVASKAVRLACERHRRDLDTGAERGLWFDESAARVAIAFFRLLKHSKGEWAGQVMRLEPWQQFVVGSLFGWKREDGLRRFRTAYMEVARKNGKALSLDTPLPTPKGWTTIRDVRVGDVLFDEKGKQCHITFITDVQIGRTCYEMEFSDGCTITADAEHLWYTDARRNGLPRTGRGPKSTWEDQHIRTTKQIRDTLAVGSPFNLKRKRVEWNHRVPVSGPLELPEIDLPIPPYILGAWLGDGHSTCGRITAHDDDYWILERIRKLGVPVREVNGGRNGKTATYALSDGDRTQEARDNSLASKLRELGVLGNKHIPRLYLRGAIEQRKALLRGLMDTDGYVSKAGQCEYTSVSALLVEDVHELITSLGFKASIIERRAKLYGRDCGAAYRITFFAYAGSGIFGLERKAQRLKPQPHKPTRALNRQIVAVREIESVPVRCIQVDSPSHLYLAGRGLIPTHNTTMVAGIGLYLLVADNEPGAEIYSAATKRDQARLSHGEATRMAKSSPQIRRLVTIYKDNIHIKDTAAKFEPLGADADTIDGLNVHGALVDELHAHKTREVWDQLETATGSRRQPLMAAITTSGFDRQSICYLLHDYTEKILTGVIEDDSWFGVIYSLDDEDEWEDETNWIKANPNLGVSKKWDDMRRKAMRAKEMPSALNAFLRLELDVWTESETKWMNMEHWKQCGAMADAAGLRGRICYAGLDLSSNIDISALLLIMPPQAPDDLYQILCRFWIPEESMQERIHNDRVPYDVWVRQGYITATPGNVIDYSYILAQIDEDMQAYDIQELAFDRWGATKIQTDLMELGGEDWLVQFGQGFSSMSGPMKELEKLVLGHRLAHGNNPVLTWMADNLVARQDPAGNIKPDKAKSREKIDGIVALIMGLDRALRHEPRRRSVYEDRGLFTA